MSAREEAEASPMPEPEEALAEVYGGQHGKRVRGRV
jgi:hypothetical protein